MAPWWQLGVEWGRGVIGAQSLTNPTLPQPSQLAAWIQDQLAEPQPLALVDLSAVAGGCIHGAWRVELADGRRLFLKSNGLQALP